jgi:tRNA(fMet)-specific endonuclease VapC
MAIILDADVIIRGEKGTFDFHGWVVAQPDEQFEVAAITVAELWHGVERAKGAHRTKRQQYLEAVLSTLPIIPYTEQTAYEHARVWAELESTGKMVGYYDIIVAATALERGSEVASFNQKHFTHIKGLTVIEPK